MPEHVNPEIAERFSDSKGFYKNYSFRKIKILVNRVGTGM